MSKYDSIKATASYKRYVKTGQMPIINYKFGKPIGKDPKKFYYVTSEPQLESDFYVKKSDIEKGPQVYAAKDKADAMKRAKREQRDRKIVVVGEAQHDDKFDRMRLVKSLQMAAKKQYEDRRFGDTMPKKEMKAKKSKSWFRFRNPFKNKREGR